MKSIAYDTSEIGLQAVLKNWEIEALRTLWRDSKGLNSRLVWIETNRALKTGTISRASIINFLEDLRKMGVLSGIEETGKGGYHWVYRPALNEAEFKSFIAEKLISNIKKSFPEETKIVLKSLGL